jgi:Plasmid pRiA4b ORF-3-like protein
MTRRPKQPLPTKNLAPSATDANAIVQVKVWLLGISPMVWRRVVVPLACTLRELHGVLQVAMGWEGIHLYQFCLRAARYGSWELSASSPDAAIPKGYPVCLRVRLEHSVAPRGSHRGSPAVGSGKGIPDLHRRQRCLPAGGQWRTSGLHGWARCHAITGCPRGSRNHGRDHRPGRVGSPTGSPRRG